MNEKMENVLVTGGAGFIGSSLIEALLPRDIRVTVLDNFSTGLYEDIKKFEKSQNFRLVNGDVLDGTLLKKLLENADSVFHLSANPEVRIGITDTEIDYKQNINATYNLLNAMRQSSSCKKIIFTSSSTVYGEALKMPTGEEYAPLVPISLYGASKLACEAMISGFCHMFDMIGVVIRLANIVGPRSRHGVIYDFVKKLESDSSRLEILGDGKQNKSYLYIDDCVNSIFKLGNTNHRFDAYNIGSDDQIPVSEIGHIVINEMGVKNTEIIYTGGHSGAGWKGDVKDMILDCSKAKMEGWHPKYTSAEAVRLSAKGIVDNISTDR